MESIHEIVDAAEVRYALEPSLGIEEFRQVLVDSGLGVKRPVADDARLGAMLAGASVIVTARLAGPAGRLLGFARGITDAAWCCYVSEVAVSPSAQRLGIGRGLLDAMRRELGPDIALMLFSVPEATGFYDRIGMERVPDAFWFPPESR